MRFKDYWADLSADEKKDFANKVNKKPAYLRHVARGRKPVTPELAKEFETHSNGAVTRHEERPDIFDEPQPLPEPIAA